MRAKGEQYSKSKKRHNILVSVLGGMLVIAVSLLAYDSYLKSSFFSTLFNAYGTLAENSETAQSFEAATDSLETPQQSGNQPSLLQQIPTVINGSNGQPGVPGVNGTNGINGADGVATCPNGICASLQVAPTTQETGYVFIDGLVANTLQGNGASITDLNASSLNAGTLSDARLSGAVTLLGNTFNGASQLVQTTAGGALPVLSAQNLTNLNASAVLGGSLADARLSANVTLQGNAFNGASQLVQTTGAGALPALSGANLTSLNASNVSTGMLADARLSTAVTLQGNSFNAANQLVQLNGSGELPAVSGANLTNIPSDCADTCVNLQAATPGSAQTGHINISGTAIAANFSGGGSGLTSLNASAINAGTLADARLSAAVTTQGNTFNGSGQLVQTTAGGALPVLSGANLTGLNASNVSTGTLADARLSANVTVQGNTFNGASQLVQTTAGGVLPVISGENLTNLSATSVSSGTLNDARLSGNVTLQGNSFNVAGALVQLNGSSQLPAVSGALLTDINATNVTTGTLADARLSANVTLQTNTFNGANQLVQLTAGGLLPVLSGANLTSLNASNISSGSLADARLSSNVALLDRNAQVFTGNSAVFRNNSNSAAAFEVQSSTNNSALSVNTLTDTVLTDNQNISSSLTLGAAGTALSQIRVYTPTLDPANVGAAGTAEQTYTVTGLATNDTVIVNKPTHTSGCGIVNVRVSAANTLAITWVNVLAVLGCNPPSETYQVIAIRS